MMGSNQVRTLRAAIVFVQRTLGLALLAVTPAFAGLGASVVPSFPTPEDVGDIKTATVTIKNNSTTPNNTENVDVSGIHVTPSCAASDGFACQTVDPGVFQFSALVGKTGTSCQGVTFTAINVDPGTGEFELSPNKAWVLGPSDGSGALPFFNKICVIQLNYKVLRAPIDSSPPNPPLTTDSLANASLVGETTGNTGQAAGGSQATINAPHLQITKNPKDQQITAGDTAMFTIVVDNTLGTGDATNIQLNDPLPNVAGLNWQLSPAVSGCSVSGSNPQVLSCNALAVPAGQTQTLTVSAQTSAQACAEMDNTATITATNTFALTPPIADSGTITCIQQAGLVKSFSPTTIAANGTTTLTFTITNPAANNPSQTVSFTDNLPAKLQVAANPNVVEGAGCSSGTVTAVAGSQTIAVAETVAASDANPAVCTVSVDVTNVPLQVGNCPDVGLTNTFNSISNPINLINNVTDSCVTVTQQRPSLNKAFSPTTIADGGTSTLTFTVSNPAPFNPAQVVGFTDNLPSGLKLAANPNVQQTCTGGTITAVAGATTVTVTGVTVPASTASPSTCTVSVDVTNQTGQYNADCSTFPAAFTNAGAVNTTGINNVPPGSLVNILDAVTQSCIVVPPPQALGIIAHTTTTCSDYVGQASGIVLDQINYSVSGGTIDQGINPGVFFYYTTITTTTANQVVTVSESHTGTAANFQVHNTEAKLYTADCNNSTDGTLTPDSTGATYTIATPGTYVIGIKYDSKSIAGTAAPVPSSITYTFTTTLGSQTNASVLLADPSKALLIGAAVADVSPGAPIPALSEWAIGLTSLLVAALGAVVLRLRRQT
jgi:uncharacterized repeat protein (TIGR01451 family)